LSEVGICARGTHLGGAERIGGRAAEGAGPVMAWPSLRAFRAARGSRAGGGGSSGRRVR